MLVIYLFNTTLTAIMRCHRSSSRLRLVRSETLKRWNIISAVKVDVPSMLVE
jgi:hypothetical protein